MSVYALLATDSGFPTNIAVNMDTGEDLVYTSIDDFMSCLGAEDVIFGSPRYRDNIFVYKKRSEIYAYCAARLKLAGIPYDVLGAIGENDLIKSVSGVFNGSKYVGSMRVPYGVSVVSGLSVGISRELIFPDTVKTILDNGKFYNTGKSLHIRFPKHLVEYVIRRSSFDNISDLSVVLPEVIDNVNLLCLTSQSSIGRALINSVNGYGSKTVIGAVYLGMGCCNTISGLSDIANDISLLDVCESDLSLLDYNIDTFKSVLCVIPYVFRLNLSNIRCIDLRYRLDDSILISNSVWKLRCPNGEHSPLSSAAFHKESRLSHILPFQFAKRSPNDSYLERVYLPESVHAIGVGAFKNCTKLFSINLNELTQLEVVSPYSFYNCESLSIVIEIHKLTALRKIGDFAFANTKVQKIGRIGTFSKEKTNQGTLILGRYAFKDCKYLREVDLSSYRVVTISEGCFVNCPSLTKLRLPKGFRFEMSPNSVSVNWFGIEDTNVKRTEPITVEIEVGHSSESWIYKQRLESSGIKQALIQQGAAIRFI